MLKRCSLLIAVVFILASSSGCYPIHRLTSFVGRLERPFCGGWGCEPVHFHGPRDHCDSCDQMGNWTGPKPRGMRPPPYYREAQFRRFAASDKRANDDDLSTATEQLASGQEQDSMVELVAHHEEITPVAAPDRFKPPVR